MRLVIDGTQAIVPKMRGARRYVSKLIAALLDYKNDINLTIFCNTFQKKLETFTAADGNSIDISFSCLPGRILDKLWTRFSYPSVDFFIGSHDIFHAPTLHLIPPTKGKLVCTVHDLVPLLFPHQCSPEYVHNFATKLELIKERADAVIADSESTKVDIINRMNFRPESIFVIPLAPSLQLLTHNLSSDATFNLNKRQITKPYLLYVGGAEPHKNLVTLIKVFRILKKESKIFHKLVMVGDNIAEAFHQDHPDLIRDSDKDIVFTGYVPDEQLPDIYRNADAFVFLSLYEGFGLVLLEAMQFGLPIVASNTSSIPEVVGENAVLVNPMDIEEIKEAILKVLGDETLRDELKTKSRLRSGMFSWESTVSQTIDVYKQLLL